MKLLLLSPFLLLQFSLLSQGLPQWYLDEIERKEGNWQADNSIYQNENEPYEHYHLEWVKGPHGNELFGQLYGTVNGKKSAVFWSFHQYYDAETEEVVILQIGMDGTSGKGTLSKSNDTLRLEQRFKSLSSDSRMEGHLTIILDEGQEQGTSYAIDSDGNWIQRRTYLWVKK